MAEGRKRITGKSTSSQETKKKRLGAKTQEYKHPEYDKELQDDTSFCPACGNKVGENAPAVSQPVKVMLDPTEAMPERRLLTVASLFKDRVKHLV